MFEPKFMAALQKRPVYSAPTATEQPPSYTDCNIVRNYDPCTVDLAALQRECVRIAEEEKGKRGGPTATKRVARLRVFMRYVLSVEYEPQGKNCIAEADENEFLDVAAYMTDLRNNNDESKTSAPTANYCRYLTQEIMTNTVEPARELGISVQIVLAIILRYAANLNDSGRYVGCLYALEHAGRHRDLCNKLYTDAFTVIPAVYGIFSFKRIRLMKAAEYQLELCKIAHSEVVSPPSTGGRGFDSYFAFMKYGYDSEKIGDARWYGKYERSRTRWFRFMGFS